MFDFDEMEQVDPSIKEESPPEAAKPLNRPVRVLGIHGGGENANVMRYRLTPLRKELGKDVEFDFIEGLREWKQEVHPVLQQMFGEGGEAPFYGWYGVTHTAEGSGRSFGDVVLDPSVEFTYSDLEPRIERVEQYIQDNGPFDVVFGFSQGCIVITLLTAMLLKKGTPLPWRMNILCCAIPPRDKRYDDLTATPLNVPTLLIYGKKDDLYRYGQKLRTLYVDPLVIEHEDGHKLPADGWIHKKIGDSIRTFCPVR